MAEVIDDTESFTIALTPVVVPAKGEIVNLNYPASVEHGKTFDINAAIKNVGGSPAVFQMKYTINGTPGHSPTFTLSAGQTSSDKFPPAVAPTSGTSISIAVKCIRIV